MLLLEKLRRTPVDYRHPLAIMDDRYQEWRPEGRPAYDLATVAGVPVLMVKSTGVAYLLADVSEQTAPEVAAFVARQALNELHVPGGESFRLLRQHLIEGQWRLSRNYEAMPDSFLPRRCRHVRSLMPEDRTVVEAACAEFSAIGRSRSTMRDFNYMTSGLPVDCHGAFVDDRMVAFCSANPIYRGLTEISWIVVADGYRRQGLAAGLLTAQARQAFGQGNRVAYYAGSAGEDTNALVLAMGFHEVKGSFRFIPASAHDQWRATWGREV